MPYRGPTKAILNWHLGLRVPKDAEKCWIMIDGQRYFWEDDKVMIFDDTYEHEVHNDTDEERIVLFLHVKRPVRFPGSLVASGFLAAVKASPFIQDALKNIEKWNSTSQVPIQ